MKTFKRTVNEPRLKIYYDEDPMNPREDTNTTLFLLKSDDKAKEIIQKYLNTCRNMSELKTAVCKEITEKYGKIYYSCFITKYEHSGIALHQSLESGFDSSFYGFAFITQAQVDETGLTVEKMDNEHLSNVVDNELNEYNSYLNNEIYRFELYDENGEFEDSYGGFYYIEDIRECLPEEFNDENLEDYFINR